MPGFAPGGNNLTVGPAFATFSGDYTLVNIGDRRVVPVIDGVVCGIQLNPPQGLGPKWSYFAVVDPASLAPRCGRPAAVVRFRLDLHKQDGSVVALGYADQTGVWQPGGVTALDLTFNNLATLPVTGSGATSTSGVTRLLVGSAVTGVLGLLSGVAGFLRRRSSVGRSS
jgi:hypothetical protein